MLRQALHRHLVWLQSAVDVENWAKAPITDSERAFEQVADWGPAEDWADWADWADAAR